MKPIFTLRAADLQLYRAGDDLSGALILPMLLFSPWALGTTENWAIWCMNFAGYALGVLLLLKLFIRHAKGYAAPRWDNYSTRTGDFTRRPHPLTRLLARTLGILTLAVLAEILISALNAGAHYNWDNRIFTYKPHLSWLPYSLDEHLTWFNFWMYLGMAASFWSVADWLLGTTLAEERRAQVADDPEKAVPLLPARLCLLLWVLCVNGAILGIEGIVQRASGTNKLLFLVPSQSMPEAILQFGPYAYRSNAAQYFNQLWPVCLGFWCALQRAGGLRGKAQHWLLLCATIMAACPIISTSRAGALTAVSILIMALIYLAGASLSDWAGRNGTGAVRWGTAGLLILFLTATLSLGWFFGWSSLAPRLDELGAGYQGREETYAAAAPMAHDYPVFGIGAGAFPTVFQLYQLSGATYTPRLLHNDWLQTRITFGWVGFILLLAALACIGLRWFVPGGIRGSRRFVVLAWLGLSSALVQARFDFPFSIHSTLFLFLVICAMLFGLSRNPGGSRR